MSNKVLVTGSNGQLGRELQDAASRHPDFEFVFLSRSELSISDTAAVNELFDLYQPAFCINCAAYTAVDKAESDKQSAFLINGEAVGVLAAACRKRNARLIHISTDYVFNGTSTKPYREEDAVDPVNAYGASKLKGEQLALGNDGDSIVIRTSWVYSMYGNNFVKTMMRLMNERKELKVVDDQLGSPTYAADLASAILFIMQSGVWVSGIYHFSNEGVISWFQFAQKIKEITDSGCNILPVPSTEYPTPAKRPGYSVLNKAKIKATYSVALEDWEDSLRNCIARIMAG